MPRILIVDDDDASREILTEFFTEEGFAVRKAQTGPEALEALTREAPDVVLLDLMLPGFDGIVVLEQYRALAPDRPAGVVVLTATNPTPYADQLAALGVEQVVAKPYDLDVLLAVIRGFTDALSAGTV